MQSINERLWPDSETILERSRGVFFTHWEELLRLRHSVVKSADPNDIHDLRVASRRFRAALELFYPFAPKGAKTELKKSVRKLTRVLGDLRNIDEALLFFQEHAGNEGSPDNTLCRRLVTLRSQELKRIIKNIKAFDYHTFDRMVREIVAVLNMDAISRRSSLSMLAYFSEVSIKQFLPIHQMLQVSLMPEQHSTRHALRIAIKKWRYFLEIVSTILDREYTPLLEQLKEYQTFLGKMNDINEFVVLTDNLKLPGRVREYVTTTLKSEEKYLLERFSELTDLKPLTYTFLI